MFKVDDGPGRGEAGQSKYRTENLEFHQTGIGQNKTWREIFTIRDKYELILDILLLPKQTNIKQKTPHAITINPAQFTPVD